MKSNLAAAALLAVTALPAGASTVYSITSGSTTTIVDLQSSAQSAESYYNAVRTGTDPNHQVAEGAAQLFLHEDTTATGAGRVSLGFIVDDGVDNGGGDTGGGIRGWLTGTPPSATPGVDDDPGDIQPWESADGYFKMGWAANNLDGWTIGGLGNADWTIELNLERVWGITDFLFMSGDSSNPTVVSFANPRRTTLYISAFTPQLSLQSGDPQTGDVPLPAGLPLLAGALGLLGLASRRRRNS